MTLSSSSGKAQMELHSSWEELTDRQRAAINEVWDEHVIPALEEVDTMRHEHDAALLEAQDARSQARAAREDAERRAASERTRRQELHHRVAELESRLLEAEEGIRLAA